MIGNTYVRSRNGKTSATYLLDSPTPSRIGNATSNLPLLITCEYHTPLKSDEHVIYILFSDGFALNIGRDEWMGDRVADAYSAAQSSGTNFKLFLSLDMTCVALRESLNVLNVSLDRFPVRVRSTFRHLNDGLYDFHNIQTSLCTKESLLSQRLLVKDARAEVTSLLPGLCSRMYCKET